MTTRPAASGWRDADRLFDEALGLAPAELGGWLDRHCGGEGPLRRQVDALLAADAAAVRFLEIDCVRMAEPLIDLPTAEAGRTIGPFRIVRELGRGGMGIVYLVERSDDPIAAGVALKVIRRPVDTERVRRRFLAEGAILGHLHHANIARLLGGGVTDDGRPYFALEFVAGSTLLDHCRARDAGVGWRLRLFLQVCDAVEYAHGQRVVHRDLKPGNILVSGDGRVKLLDFGIAKLIEGGEDEWGDEALTAPNTDPGERLFTPEYAAPEQIRGEAITPATDIHALGAILYELLSGRPAWQVERRTDAEIVRAVLETAPPEPSMVAPEAVRGSLRGDLDRIVLRALAKEPKARYQTVAEFGAEIALALERL